jgi:hypothetical protein
MPLDLGTHCPKLDTWAHHGRERTGRSVRRTSSVTMPTASSSIAAGSTRAAQFRARVGALRELVEAMRAIATTGVAPTDQKDVYFSIKWKTNKAELCPAPHQLRVGSPVESMSIAIHSARTLHVSFGERSDLAHGGPDFRV